MSDTIIKSAQPAKQKLEDLLDEVKAMDLTLPDQHLAVEQLELKRRTIEEKIGRLKLYVGTLGSINEKWSEYIQKQKNAQKRKQEEDKYADMVDDDKDMYKDEFEVAVQRLQQSMINNERFQQKELSQMSQQIVNLPQLPLPTFNGDPKSWREFWDSFDATVHFQKIPDIQKLNYLISCLRGNMSQSKKHSMDLSDEITDLTHIMNVPSKFSSGISIIP
uniref:Uncharacterized protein n=1 Tax=Loa loa TaxID=7209 RepID=A0A1I7VI10_LOALO